MIFFLQLVGAFVVALILLILVVYFYIKWKFRSVFKDFAEALKNIAGGAPVPPFRVKLLRKKEYFADDPEEYEDVLDNPHDFKARVEEFASLGFEKIDDYYIEEIPLSMTAFVDRETSTYGVIYDHPMAGVWCDVVRRYEDGSGWTFGTNQDPLMDYPVNKTIKFFPTHSLTEVVETFKTEAPAERAILVSNEEFPKFFERAYAEEMDWRIERGGATEAEIRRIAERDEIECTPEHIHTIQMQWRMAISEFYSQRVLRRYRKDHNLSRSDWEQLEETAVVAHQQMQAEEIFQAFDEDYYPDMGFQLELDEEDDDPEYRAERDKWERRIEEIREQLKTDPPQTVFRRLVQNSDEKDVEWEFKAAVEKPVPADIWLRHWKDEYDDGEYDDEYEEDDWED